MGLLNRFFRSSTETRAKEIVEDDATMIKLWQDYLASTKEKELLIGAMQPGTELPGIIKQLKNIVALELVKISEEEKTEKELLADITAIEHDENVKRVHRLETCLYYAETKYKYVHRLLEELLLVLKKELQVVEKLGKSSQNEATFIQKLKEDWQLEKTILDKITYLDKETFHNLFVDLLKGEHVVQQLTEKEAKLTSTILKQMVADKGLLAEWASEVVKAIKDKIHELIANEILEQHADVDFEFVYRQEFVDMVRTILKSLQSKYKQEVSESEINVFVHVFREGYRAG